MRRRRRSSPGCRFKQAPRPRRAAVVAAWGAAQTSAVEARDVRQRAQAVVAAVRRVKQARAAPLPRIVAASRSRSLTSYVAPSHTARRLRTTNLLGNRLRATATIRSLITKFVLCGLDVVLSASSFPACFLFWSTTAGPPASPQS